MPIISCCAHSPFFNIRNSNKTGLTKEKVMRRVKPLRSYGSP